MFRQLVIISILISFAAVSVLAAQSEEIKGGEKIVVNGTNQGVAPCQACHGADGWGRSDTGIPRIAGYPGEYLLKQLQAFKDGTRKSEDMKPIADRLSKNEVLMVTAYYSNLTPEMKIVNEAEVAKPVEGWRLAMLGKWKEGIPPCFRCHGKNAGGIPSAFPPLAGQYGKYIVTELQHWQSGKRRNDPLDLMRTVAERLNGSELVAISEYLSRLNPRAEAGVYTDDLAVTDIKKLATERKSEPSSAFDFIPVRSDAVFTPPNEEEIPNDEFGTAVFSGMNIFVNTQKYADKYVGNGLNCVNCHLDRGRLAGSAPMWAAYVRYPKYRSKDKLVDSMQARIQGCFKYSQNGTPPEVSSDMMTALVTYFFWMARGVPTGVDMKSGGYPELPAPPEQTDPKRGAGVYATDCAFCHGEAGQGTKIKGVYQFPPTWGSQSYNTGAGMHRTDFAAAFIKANMPFGRGGKLSLQDAWDVAAFIDSQKRPEVVVNSRKKR